MVQMPGMLERHPADTIALYLRHMNRRHGQGSSAEPTAQDSAACKVSTTANITSLESIMACQDGHVPFS